MSQDIRGLVSQVWPEWEVVGAIGRGSYATVYRAVRKNAQIEANAAIKVIGIPQDANEIQMLRSQGYDDVGVRRFYEDRVRDVEREVSVMEQLKGNTNLVSIEDYKVLPRKGAFGWDVLIRMELLMPLLARFKNTLMTEMDLYRLGCDLSDALVLCRKHNIVHRDIKPENIFLNADGRYKLGDFGVARTMAASQSAFSLKGTEMFMAPEVYKGQLRGTDIDGAARVDIYALGLVMYVMGNRMRFPFVEVGSELSPEARKKALLRRVNGEPLPRPEGVGVRLGQVILKACQADPAQRFSSAMELGAALRALNAPPKPSNPRVNAVRPGQAQPGGGQPMPNGAAQPAQRPAAQGPAPAGRQGGDENATILSPRVVSAYDGGGTTRIGAGARLGVSSQAATPQKPVYPAGGHAQVPSQPQNQRPAGRPNVPPQGAPQPYPMRPGAGAPMPGPESDGTINVRNLNGQAQRPAAPMPIGGPGPSKPKGGSDTFRIGAGNLSGPGAPPKPAKAGRKLNKVVLFSILGVLIVALGVGGFFAVRHFTGGSRGAKVGGTITFGTWEDEPLKWRILEINDSNDELHEWFIILDQVLETRAFASSDETVWSDEMNVSDDKSVQKWLEREFMNKAFTSAERNERIRRSTYPGEGSGTLNRVTLLSVDEAKRYWDGDSERVAKDRNGNEVSWWLRTGTGSGLQTVVTASGAIDAQGVSSTQTEAGIRPAMWITAE